MNGARMAGAIAGGLLAGLGLSAMMLAGERRNGEPSELTRIGRAGAARLGFPTPPADSLPGPAEQAAVHGGHLALSAAAGATYALTVAEADDGVAGGVGFGLAFYAAMHWIAGPVLGLKPPEWRSGKGAIAMHAANHAGFGLAVAAGARLAARGN